MVRSIIFTVVVPIINLKESVLLRKLSDKSLYHISNITGMDILEGMTDEKPTGEDSIDGFIHCKDEAIEYVINKHFMTPKPAETRTK